MKKLFLSLAGIVAIVSYAAAQSTAGPKAFFPDTKGATLETKTYDGAGKLICTTTYTVADAYGFDPDEVINVNYTRTDASGKVIDQGAVNAHYQEGNFYLSMSDKAIAPEAIGLIGADVEVMGSYLDYPNSNLSDPYDTRQFAAQGGSLLFKSKSDKKNFVSVREYNRHLGEPKSITTPAGTFQAVKITFTLDVYSSTTKKTTTYKGAEWYAEGAGIVRTELADKSGKLQTYTVLTQKK